MPPQMPNWIKRFHQQDLDEEKDEMDTPIKLLDPTGRMFVWWLCKQYDVLSDGVMGQTCNLVERYLSRKIKQVSHLPPRSTEWRQLKEVMAARVPLLISVGISLTTKMMNSERQVHAKTIRNVLNQLDIPSSLQEINAAELDVLSILGFSIPMFTNVEKALMMAVDVGMRGVFLEGVALVTDVAEYYRSSIQEEVISIAFSMREDKSIQRQDITNVRHMHLVAGSVLATGRLFVYPGPDYTPRLCFLTQCSRIYITCIGNLIHNRLVTEFVTTFTKPSRKRKLSITE